MVSLHHRGSVHSYSVITLGVVIRSSLAFGIEPYYWMQSIQWPLYPSQKLVTSQSYWLTQPPGWYPVPTLSIFSSIFHSFTHPGMQEILVELLFYDKYYHGTEDKIKQMETSAKPHHTIIGGFKKQIIRKKWKWYFKILTNTVNEINYGDITESGRLDIYVGVHGRHLQGGDIWARTWVIRRSPMYELQVQNICWGAV